MKLDHQRRKAKRRVSFCLPSDSEPGSCPQPTPVPSTTILLARSEFHAKGSPIPLKSGGSLDEDGVHGHIDHAEIHNGIHEKNAEEVKGSEGGSGCNKALDALGDLNCVSRDESTENDASRDGRSGSSGTPVTSGHILENSEIDGTNIKEEESDDSKDCEDGIASCDNDVELFGSDDNDDEIASNSSSDGHSADSDGAKDSTGCADVRSGSHDGQQVNETSRQLVEPAEPVQVFSNLNLDPRLEHAIEKLGWERPTSVQGAVLPNALRGRDMLVTAPTGTGKTAAYAIPIVQHVCRAKALSGPTASSIHAVVIVPTRELVHQVTSVLKSLCRFVTGVRVINSCMRRGTTGHSRKHPRKRSKAGSVSEAVAENSVALTHGTEIMVGTPASLKSLHDGGNVNPFCTTGFAVVDEADLVLSYGYEKDAHALFSMIPTSAQCMLLSATLDVDYMDQFRKAVLRSPLTVKITSVGSEAVDDCVAGASHYVSRLKNYGDRYLVTYAMLRLKVLQGKVLIFVNHINSAFRLKLFLDQFKLKSAVLNGELPANSRIHCVHQFNAGVFDTLIAVDDSEENDTTSSKPKRSVGKKRRRLDDDHEFGLSRGVDFKDVAAVLNYDLASSPESYTHRAGRTARGGKPGTVLSLVCSDEEEKRLERVSREVGVHVGPLAFRMEQVEPFRYRVEDCLRLITDTVVRGARLADIRREMEASEQLKTHFKSKPEDLDALQHTFRLAKNVPEHLAHVPSYLLPAAFRGLSEDRNGVGRGFRNGKRNARFGKPSSVGRNGKDPLKAFSLSGSSRARFQKRHGIRKRVRS